MSAVDTLRTALFGNPVSSTFKPSRDGVFQAIKDLRSEIASEIAVAAIAGVVSVTKTTRALLDADLAHNAGTVAFVYADATATNNDIYVKVGASGSGSWTLTPMFNDIFQNIATELINDRTYSDGALNFGFGDSFGSGISTGTNNSVFGALAGRDLASGSHNVLAGWGTAYLAAGLSDSVIVGSGAGLALTGTKSAIVAIGRSAGGSYNSNELTAVGWYALHQATGLGNTAVGTSAGNGITTGARNTFLGYSANGVGARSDSIAIGYAATVSRDKEIKLGTEDQIYLDMFGIKFGRWEVTNANLWIGDDGPVADPTGLTNFGIGRSALNSVTTGSANLGLGSGALESQATGNNSIAIGVVAGQFGTALFDCTIGGVKAGRYMTDGTGATLWGFRALEHCDEALNNTAIGDSALWHIQGSGNTASGYVVAEGLETGDDNVFEGKAAGRYRKNASDSVFIGVLAGALTSYAGTTNLVEASPGASLGTRPTAGSRVVAIGKESLEECLGNDVVAVGYRAGRSLVSTAAVNLKSTFLGANAGNHGSQKVDAVNSVALGADSYTDKDNQVVLGNTSITETVIYGVQRGRTYTVAALPSAATMGAGARAFVTDATATTFASIVAGGGANGVPVYSDGTNWRIG